MFCQNCGKELQNGEAYCSRCGIKAGERSESVKVDFGLNEKLQGVDSIGKSIDSLGDSKLTYFAALLLQIVSIFLVGSEMFTVSYQVFYTTHYSQYTLFEDNEGLRTLFTIIYIVAAVAMLIPLLLQKEWKRQYFIAGIAMPLISLVWFVVAFISAKNKVGSSDYAGLMEAAKVSITLSGNAWLFLLISAAAALLTYLSFRNLTFAQELRKKRAERDAVQDNVGEYNGVVCPKCGAVQKRGSAFCEKCYTPLFKLK